jgi:hypothetical protein
MDGNEIIKLSDNDAIESRCYYSANYIKQRIFFEKQKNKNDGS